MILIIITIILMIILIPSTIRLLAIRMFFPIPCTSLTYSLSVLPDDAGNIKDTPLGISRLGLIAGPI
jgi:hypothetical protein